MTTDAIETGLRDAWARLRSTRREVEAGAPWPLASEFGHTPEASWGPSEVLAHVAEMIPYWHVELARVAAGAPDGSPVPFGRVATDTTRIGTLERLRVRPPAELYDRIDEATEAFLAAWATWTEAERSRLGLHPARGELTVEAGIARIIVGHLGEHVDQLEASIGSAPAG